MAMEGLLSRALLKLHYMREHPVMNSWSSVHLVNFGKIQEEGQSAGNFNFVLDKGSSETTCEAIKFASDTSSKDVLGYGIDEKFK
jgi:hypothetical protein